MEISMCHAQISKKKIKFNTSNMENFFIFYMTVRGEERNATPTTIIT